MINTTGTNRSVENLPIFMCLLIDTPKQGLDCSLASNNSYTNCVECRVRSDYYLTGESVNDYYSLGHLICLVIWAFATIVGIFGICGSLLIITVLRRRATTDKGFDYLLMNLAYVDMLCCAMGVIAASCYTLYFGNWSGRGIVTLYVFYLSWIALLFGRSASQYMTVAITIERYLVITFPFRSAAWFTRRRTKICVATVLALAVLLSIPRSTSRIVTENTYRQNGIAIECLRNLDYYLSSTRLTKFWYRTLRSVHYQIDFWLPLPLLLVFNSLSYWQVLKMSRKRRELNVYQQKEIQAVRMFLPVVIILVGLNTAPISMFIMVHFFQILYREVFITTIFSICLNSAVNFGIYYLRGSSFRAEVQKMLSEWICRFKEKFKTNYNSNSQGTVPV